MKNIIICVITLCFVNIYGQTTYTEFKNAFKKNQKKYTLVDQKNEHLIEALQAFNSSQNPIFKRLSSKYLKSNETIEAYLALGQYLEDTPTYMGSELCKWLLEKARDKWSDNSELNYFLAYLYEKFAREYRSMDIANRLLILNAKSIYENMIKENSNNLKAKYHLARYALEDLEEHYNSIITNNVVPLRSKKDYEMLNAGRVGTPNIINDNEKYKILNSVSLKYKGNSRHIIDKSISIIKKYRPTPNDTISFDYHNLLLKMFFINGEYKECINTIDKLDDSFNTYGNHLMRGICNFKLQNYKEANNDFVNAIHLMDITTRNDFTFNSFHKILNTTYFDDYSTQNEKIKKLYIEAYLRLNDPLYLTKENERLVEHYYRVAYSNLFFCFDIDNRKKKIDGWNTERGEVFIRYGEPLKIERFRPDIINKEDAPNNVKLKTELWTYKDKEFAFVDKYLNNNYTFVDQVNGVLNLQYSGNTNEFIESYRVKNSDEYIFESKGAIVNVDYNLYQLKSLEDNLTDIILSYQIIENDSISDLYKQLSYKSGFYFIDDYTNVIDSKTNILNLPSNKINENNLFTTKLNHQVANVSFEILRNNDKGAYSNKGRVTIIDYTDDELMVSDIILAEQIEFNKKIINSIIRNNLSIIPLSKKEITKDDELWLYFEIYNLELENRLNKFSQNIEIQKIDEDGGVLDSFNEIGEFIGLSEKSDVEISSRYQTSKNDEQIYFKLDMSEMETGKYKIIVSIKDENRDEEISKSLIINYKN